MGVPRSLRKKQPYYLIAYRILLALLWTQYTVLNFARVIIERLPYIGFLSSLFIPTCIILALIVSLPWFVKNVRGTDFLFYFVFVIVVVLTMVLFKNNAEILQEQWWRILISAVPFYFIGVSYSYSACSKDLFWCSLAGVVFVFLYQLYKLSNGTVLEDDNMYAAYNLLPSVMYLVYYAMIRNRKKYWLIAVLSACSMFVFGTRGPILCIIIFVAVYYLYENLTSHIGKKFILLFLVVAVLLFVFVYEDVFLKILSAVASVFEKIGFSTRIFDFYLAGDVAVSKGRDYLTSEVIDAIIRNPIVGYGMVGDQYLLGVYCHNLILEMWCHYGIILGTLVLAILATVSVLALVRSSKSKKLFYFALMLICMVYVKLMLSSTYTVEPYFYFMIGIFMGIKRKMLRAPSGFISREKYGDEL